MHAISSSLMILIAGPYRSGSGDDPAKMAANVQAEVMTILTLAQASAIIEAALTEGRNRRLAPLAVAVLDPGDT